MNDAVASRLHQRRRRGASKSVMKNDIGGANWCVRRHGRSGGHRKKNVKAYVAVALSVGVKQWAWATWRHDKASWASVLLVSAVVDHDSISSLTKE